MRSRAGCILLAGAVGGCSALGTLSDMELREFKQLEAKVIAVCKRAEPGEARRESLKGPLDRMIALMREDPHHWYDSNPANSPGIEDESSPALDLAYIGGLLDGTEGTPACNRTEAKRVIAVAGAEFD